MPTISVPVSVYRCPAMLLQSAGSVLAQTHTDLKLLIGVNPEDDEGPNLWATVEMLGAFDGRVRIVDCSGCRDGFAKGMRLIEACRSEWVSGIDYDDLWYPEKLERQLPYIDRYDVVSTGACYFGDKCGVIEVPGGELTARHFRTNNPVISTSAMARRSDLLKMDAAYRGWAFDYKLYVDLLNAGRKFYALPDVLTLLPAGAAQILYKESGTGTKWAIVRLGLPPGAVSGDVVLDAQLAPAGSAVASFWDGDPMADTGNNATVYDGDANWSLMSTGSTAFPAGTRAVVKWRPKRRKWQLENAACAAS